MRPPEPAITREPASTAPSPGRAATGGTAVVLLLALLLGCATQPEGSGGNPGDGDTAAEADAGWDDADGWNGWEEGTWDPLERYNRWVFAFNETLDSYVVRPAAVAYRDRVPRGVRRPLGSFVDNLQEPFRAGNHYLQGDPGAGTRSVTRFLINSTVGLLGLFDVAGAAGLERKDTDLGLTLGHWGAPEGPYLVLPALGPSTLRDSSGLAGEYLTRTYHRPMHWADLGRAERYSRAALTGLDTRVDLLSLDELMAETGTDPYIFMRESYLQNRRERLGEDDWDDWDDWDDGDGWDDEWNDGDDGDDDSEWEDDGWDDGYDEDGEGW